MAVLLNCIILTASVFVLMAQVGYARPRKAFELKPLDTDDIPPAVMRNLNELMQLKKRNQMKIRMLAAMLAQLAVVAMPDAVSDSEKADVKKQVAGVEKDTGKKIDLQADVADRAILDDEITWSEARLDALFDQIREHIAAAGERSLDTDDKASDRVRSLLSSADSEIKKLRIISGNTD